MTTPDAEATRVVETWITETGIDPRTAKKIRDGIRIYTACLQNRAS